VLYILAKTGKGLSGETLIVDYAVTWLDDVHGRRMAFYRQNEGVVAKLQLRHLEALYELLEDIQGAAILKHISSEAYGKPLPPEAEPLLAEVAEAAGGWAALEACWRRFVTRYLRGPSPPEPSHGLQDYLTLVPWQKAMVDKSADDRWMQLTVGHSLSLLKHIQVQWGPYKPRSGHT
jgi:hypothetical protein